FDVLGKQVAELVNEQKQPGNYEINFDAKELSSGIYYYTMKVNGNMITKKMILLK
ncbi:MAG: T9SS type A sorting domain-containing protein, partial [Ignavibacteriae bacterium]|nr:T9SS type A sorting domain-containing protein [Ignavibacteriota bacterium]